MAHIVKNIMVGVEGSPRFNPPLAEKVFSWKREIKKKLNEKDDDIIKKLFFN